MNRQFWGVARAACCPCSLARGRRERPSRRVYSHDASPAWGFYMQAGPACRRACPTRAGAAGIDRSQLALVIHEKHFNRHDYMIWKSYGTVRPVFVLRADGVPIVSVYKRPK